MLKLSPFIADFASSYRAMYRLMQIKIFLSAEAAELSREALPPDARQEAAHRSAAC